MRQPLPKARPLTFSAGAAWRRLNSAPRSSRATRATSAGSAPSCDQFLRRAQLLDQGLQQGIEHGVVGQGIAVALVGAQLGAGGLGADRRADQLPAVRQAQGRAAGGGGLRHRASRTGRTRWSCRGRRSRPGRRSCRRRGCSSPPPAPTCCRWRAAGRPCWLATAISSVPRIRDCRFSSVTPSGGPPRAGVRAAAKASISGAIGRVQLARPSRAGQGGGIVEGTGRAEGRGHAQHVHPLRTEGGGGDHRHQGRIDAAAEPQQGPPETAFGGVVAHPQHQHPQQLLPGIRLPRRVGGLGIPRRRGRRPTGPGPRPRRPAAAAAGRPDPARSWHRRTPARRCRPPG